MMALLVNLLSMAIILANTCSISAKYCSKPDSLYCDEGQVCCKNECFRGPNCNGRDCELKLDCSSHESCCKKTCVSGSSCLGHHCDYKEDCLASESCCRSVCIDQSSCVGRPCFTASDCSSSESCCNNTCVHGLGCPCSSNYRVYCSPRSCCNGNCRQYCDGEPCSSDANCFSGQNCCSGTCRSESCFDSFTAGLVGSILAFIVFVGLTVFGIVRYRRYRRRIRQKTRGGYVIIQPQPVVGATTSTGILPSPSHQAPQHGYRATDPRTNQNPPVTNFAAVASGQTTDGGKL